MSGQNHDLLFYLIEQQMQPAAEQFPITAEWLEDYLWVNDATQFDRILQATLYYRDCIPQGGIVGFRPRFKVLIGGRCDVS